MVINCACGSREPDGSSTLMNDLGIRSPAAEVESLMYFGRMLDKIRQHDKGELPADYQANLGKGFDRRCVKFLGVDYAELRDEALRGRSDEELLAWSFERGRRPSEDEIHIWNEFMRKCGWNDDVSEIVARRKKEAGLAEREDIVTMFQFIDADEGRPIQL